MIELTETEVLNSCLAYLKSAGIFCWRQNTGAVKAGNRFIRFSVKGCPDIIGVCPDGRFLGIECKKSKGGKVSPEQVQFIDEINKNGGVSFVVNDLESLIQGLKKYDVISSKSIDKVKK